METSNRAVGLLDSGVGGLTVAHEIFKLLPEEKIIYYGDTLHLPYGPKDPDLVKKYTAKIINYLIKKKNVKAVVIACNTATSAALDYVQAKFDIPILGMIKTAVFKDFNIKSQNKIALIATEGTINSNLYQNELLALNDKVELYLKACPKFVKLVEKGKFKGPEVEETAVEYLAPIVEAEVDFLILGCTHFPYLRPVLAALMGENVKIINPAAATAANLKKILTELKLLNSSQVAEHKFIVSDKSKISKRFLKNGSEFLNFKTLNFKEKNIFKLESNREESK